MKIFLPIAIGITMAMSVQQIWADITFSQEATIRIRSIEDAYFVQIKVTETPLSDDLDKKVVISAPEVMAKPDQWASMSVCRNNTPPTFKVKLSLGDEDINIAHGLGSYLRIKITESKKKGFVTAKGVLSIATKKPGVHGFNHRVIPIDLNCPLAEKMVFFCKTAISK